jgi:Kef-type K+ transport system membrane component KefB
MNGTVTQALITNPVLIFFTVLVIILLAPLLLNRLKIPHVVGLIVAGVIVGPNGLNLLANDSSFAIFGQVGLLYLMFLAGLEIDMYHLKLGQIT